MHDSHGIWIILYFLRFWQRIGKNFDRNLFQSYRKSFPDLVKSNEIISIRWKSSYCNMGKFRSSYFHSYYCFIQREILIKFWSGHFTISNLTISFNRFLTKDSWTYGSNGPGIFGRHGQPIDLNRQTSECFRWTFFFLQILSRTFSEEFSISLEGNFCSLDSSGSIFQKKSSNLISWSEF